MDNTVSKYHKAEQAMNFGWFAKTFSIIENWYRNLKNELNAYELDNLIERYQFVKDCADFFTYGKFRYFNMFESKMRLIVYVYEMAEHQRMYLGLNFPCFSVTELIKKELGAYFKRLLRLINFTNWNEGVSIQQQNGLSLDRFETIDIDIKVMTYCHVGGRTNSFLFTNRSQQMIILEDLVFKTLKPLPVITKTTSQFFVSELMDIKRKLALTIELKEQKMQFAEKGIALTSRFDMLEVYGSMGFNVEPITYHDYRRYIQNYDSTIKDTTALRLSDSYVDFISNDNFLEYAKNEFFKFDSFNNVLVGIIKNVNKT